MKTIGLFFGGPSNEHEVSIKSAKNIVKNFPKHKYKLVLIYWNKAGKFFLIKNVNKLNSDKRQIGLEEFKKIFDIALLMTHGKYGEDGVLQSLLESQKIKYCGCRALSSALCMDKALCKQYLAGQKIQQVDFVVLDYNLKTAKELKRKIIDIKNDFELPIYVKPANSGSSVGITRVTKWSQITKAITEALQHDSKIVVEQGLVNPQEIEVAILGNDKLRISRAGELCLAQDFYSYDDKYKLGQATVVIPAKLTTRVNEIVLELAEKIYRLCNCSGFARLDFFVGDGRVYFNEINTLPGFTDISMYPMLMMDSDLDYSELVEEIIELAY